MSGFRFRYRSRLTPATDRRSPLSDLMDDMLDPRFNKNISDAGARELDSRKRKEKTASDLRSEFFKKVASSLIGSGAQRVGRFAGQSSANWLKPPGRAASRVPVNPNRSVRQAMSAYTGGVSQ